MTEKQKRGLRPPWPKGVVVNPGGAPKGKRISTWLAELGDKKEFPDEKKLTINGRIALKLLRIGLNSDKDSASVSADELTMNRTEGLLQQTVKMQTDELSQLSADERRKIVEK